MGRGRERYSLLPVDILAISDAHHDDANSLVFNGNDDAKIADAVLPEFPEFGTSQRFSNGAGVFKLSEAIIEKRQDAPCTQGIKLLQVFPGEVRKLNSPCYRSSSHLPVE